MVDWWLAITNISWVAVLVYVLMNPEKAEKWASILLRLGAVISSRAEKRSVASDIQSDINIFAKRMTNIDSRILPYGLRIRWENIKDATPESFIKEDQVVVRLSHHKNRAKNIVLATLAYVHSGLLPDVRAHIDEDVSKSLDFTVTRKILVDQKRLDGLQILEMQISTAAEDAAGVKGLCKAMTGLDGIGLFDLILLRELADVGKLLAGTLPQDQTKTEIREFIGACEKLAEKEPGKDVSPDFEGKRIRVSIVLIARFETYMMRGIEPHLNWIKKCIDREIDSIYVVARGPNIQIAKDVDAALTDLSLRKVGESYPKAWDARGRKVNTVCLAYKRIAHS
jgi:hypothetical protein